MVIKTGAGGDDVSHDDIFLEATERVHFGAGRGFGAADQVAVGEDEVDVADRDHVAADDLVRTRVGIEIEDGKRYRVARRSGTRLD